MDAGGPKTPVLVRPMGLSWLGRGRDATADLCAHGHVDFRVGGEVLVDPAKSLQVTVSAAALFLLRTLSRPHCKQGRVGDHLFPCCGFTMYDLPGEPDVLLLGCLSGIDFEVLHDEAGRETRICADDGREWRLPREAWQAAVFAFADAVSDFYAKASPKEPSAEDLAGFLKLKAEWVRRRRRPLV